MSKVKIVIDSTTSLPKEMAAKYDIRIAPNTLIWEGIEYRDGIDIEAGDFYKRLVTSKEMPTTAAVSTFSFREIFKELTGAGHDVLGIFPNRNFSAIPLNALMAKEELGKDNVIVFETDILAMQIIWAAIFCGRAAEKGASLQECHTLAKEVVERGAGFGMLDTLEFLERGGRIGKAQRLVGTMLNFKPILEVVDREMTGVARVRTQKKGMEMIISMAVERAQGHQPVYLAGLYTSSPDQSIELLERAAAELNPVETFMYGYGPNAGAHLGPGAMGLTMVSGVQSPD
ncbi:MAG: DegV family protein [Anaerolineae bacterium]|nr:DegV family protein [Anaerolineae bacterium]